MAKIVIGQVWKDKDRRRERYIRVLAEGIKNGEAAFLCQSVVPNTTNPSGPGYVSADKSPKVYIVAKRFGKEYSLVEDVAAPVSTSPVAA